MLEYDNFSKHYTNTSLTLIHNNRIDVCLPIGIVLHILLVKTVAAQDFSSLFA